MSNGSGPIIIHSLISAPGTKIEEKMELEKVLRRYEKEHKCRFVDALYVLRLVWRLIK